MQILNYQDIIGKPNAIGEFDLYCPSVNIPMKSGGFLVVDMTFNHLKVMRSKKGHIFVTFPSKAEKLEDQTFKFHTHTALGEKSNVEFQREVLRLLEDFLPVGSNP
jgi:hypothetical protein